MNVHEEERLGQTSDMNEELKSRTEEKIQRRQTIHNRWTKFVLYKCERWFPWISTDEHKQKLVGVAMNFLNQYNKNGDEFFN